MDALLKGAERLTPESSKWKKRQPYAPKFMSIICQHLNLDDPFDAAIFACLTTCFYAAAWVGELTIPRLNTFNIAHHVTLVDLHIENNQNGTEVTVLHIPRTNTAPIEGKDIFWSCQHSPTDPYTALENHRCINNPSNSDHLFAYHHLQPLTKTALIKRIALAARSGGLEPLQGHGIQIGATLFYLLLVFPWKP